MTYEISEFQGDEIYCINCTGNAVVGDNVRFERAIFSGSFRNSRFAGFEQITGTIVRDSYGRDKQQHTFSLALDGGGELRIKGRNLYANGTYRQQWPDESRRDEVADEKHARGNIARAARDARKIEAGHVY